MFVIALSMIEQTWADNSTLNWLHDVADARQASIDSGKPILMSFTGHGWCRPCDTLDNEVFRTQEFIKYANERYVFLEIDFNFEETAEDQQRRDFSMLLAKRYLAPAVPTIVLCDQAGRPYSFSPSYQEGSGPSAVIDWLKTSEEAKDLRNTKLLNSSNLTGLSRARQIDEALDAIAPLLGDIETRGDDPLLEFYDNLVDDILDFSGGDPSISEKYIVRLNRRDERLQEKSALLTLDNFQSTNNYSDAIKFIDSLLRSKLNDDFLWRLESSKQTYLEWSDLHEQALENSRRVQAVDGIPAEYREGFLDREAYNLFQLDRVSEAIDHYDARIAASANDREKLLKLLFWKAQMLIPRQPSSLALQAWKDYRSATEQGSPKWIEGTNWVIALLKRDNNLDEAIREVEGLLKMDRSINSLLTAAELNCQMGERIMCDEYIAEIEISIEFLKETDKSLDGDIVERYSNRIEQLKAMQGSTSKSSDGPRN